MSRGGRLLLLVSGVVILIMVVFAHVNWATRRWEVGISAAAIRHLVPNATVTTVGTTAIIEMPGRTFISATLIPSCSALASVLAVACLGLITPRGRVSRTRRTMALLGALALVVAGNLIRIIASLWVGARAGRSALILFHDVAGSMFTFVAILAAYVFFLAVQLPGSTQERTDLEVARHAPV